MMLEVPLARPRRDAPRCRHSTSASSPPGLGHWANPPSAGASVELTACLECPLGGAAVNVETRLHPRENVAHLRFAAARGQVVNLPDGQFTVPDVEIGQVPDEGLRGVESPSEHILRWRQMDSIEADVISLPRDALHGENCLCGL